MLNVCLQLTSLYSEEHFALSYYKTSYFTGSRGPGGGSGVLIKRELNSYYDVKSFAIVVLFVSRDSIGFCRSQCHIF